MPDGELTGPTLRVRNASPEMADRLAVLALQVWLHTYATEGIAEDIAAYVLQELTPAKYAAMLQDPERQVIVAEHGEHLVGLAVLNFNAPCEADRSLRVELQTLYVQAHFLGEGVGHRLLQEAQTRTLALSKAGQLWLSVNAKNARAITFYARQGYEKIGTTYFLLGAGRHENHVLVSPGLRLQHLVHAVSPSNG